MEQEILDLREEIEYLTTKVELLEKAENKRKAFFYVKILIKIIAILLFVFGIWKGYEYLVEEVPKMMEEKIKEINPLKKNS